MTSKRNFRKVALNTITQMMNRAIGQVVRGEAHLAIVTSEVPSHLGLSSKVLAETHFQTYVGKGHDFTASRKSVPVEDVLKYPFASPSHPLLGQVNAKQSIDGWRDDQFPRKVHYLTSSLKMLEELALRGQAIVYLPDYYGERLGLHQLKISGCPYVCTQKVSVDFSLAERNRLAEPNF